MEEIAELRRQNKLLKKMKSGLLNGLNSNKNLMKE